LKSDRRGASISEGFDCRVRGRPSWTAFSLERGAPAVALDVHLDDGSVVNETIDGGQRHGGSGKTSSITEGLIGGDQHAAALAACADELEQHASLGLVFGDVGKIVEDQEIEAIKAAYGGIEVKLAASPLELLHEIGGAGKEDLPFVLDKGQAASCCQVALPAAGRTSVINI